VEPAGPTNHRKTGRKPTDPQVIIDALERLLASAPLRDIKVEEILHEADVSRATFYAHFPTKFAAAAALFAQVTDEVTRATSAYFQQAEDETPVEALLRGVADSVAVWSRHRDILVTVMENEHAIPQLSEQLAAIKRQFSRAIGQEITQQRRTGAAPKGLGDHELSAALVECTFQLVYRSSIDPDPDRRLDQRTISLITALWSGTVYHLPPPGPAADPY
jgi:TetR/AcrR family transcriptional regulator, ethionamide resistance regulator